EANHHRLDARIVQHRLSRRPAAVELGKVVSLEYRSLPLDICVVAVDVLARDKISARFAFWRIRDRRAQFNWIDLGLAERPRQQRLRKRSILWPTCHDFRKGGPCFIGASVIECVVEKPGLAGE